MEQGHIHGRLTPRGRSSVPHRLGIDIAGGGFRAGAAGAKRYGIGQVTPTRGLIGNMLGYRKRDASLRARREALAQRANRTNYLGGR